MTAPQAAAMVPAEAIVRERQWAFEQGVRAVQEVGEGMLPDARKIWASPRYADLVDQREHVVTTPCGSPSCRGCSRGVRAQAVANRRIAHGHDDFPGGRVAAW